MEWAREFVNGSNATLLSGIEEYMEEEKLAFAELCREMIRRVRLYGGKMSKREIGRSFQNNVEQRHQIWSAIDHLVETEQLIEWRDGDTGGRPSIWYFLPQSRSQKPSNEGSKPVTKPPSENVVKMKRRL
jgi:hypothetical protein